MAAPRNQKQEDVLKAILQRRNPRLLPLLNKLGKQELSTLEREQIQNAVAEEMASTGVDASGEINQYGIDLDNIISFIAKS